MVISLKLYFVDNYLMLNTPAWRLHGSVSSLFITQHYKLVSILRSGTSCLCIGGNTCLHTSAQRWWKSLFRNLCIIPYYCIGLHDSCNSLGKLQSLKKIDQIKQSQTRSTNVRFTNGCPILRLTEAHHFWWMIFSWSSVYHQYFTFNS